MISPLRATLVSVVFCALLAGVTTAAIFLTGQDARPSVQSFAIISTAGTAAATSLAFAVKSRKYHFEISRAVSYLSIGLVLWVIAEVVWAYYVNVVGIDVPYPSIADVFYLAGYLPLGISLYSLTRSAAVPQENRLVMTAVAVTIAAFITNVFLLQIVDSVIGFTRISSDEAILLVVGVAYPLLDGFLLVPALIALYAFRKSGERLTWVLVAISMLVMAVADTGFDYTALVEIDALASETIWDVMYNAGYILLATGMVNGLVTKRQESQILQQNPAHP